MITKPELVEVEVERLVFPPEELLVRCEIPYPKIEFNIDLLKAYLDQRARLKLCAGNMDNLIQFFEQARNDSR